MGMATAMTLRILGQRHSFLPYEGLCFVPNSHRLTRLPSDDRHRSRLQLLIPGSCPLQPPVLVENREQGGYSVYSAPNLMSRAMGSSVTLGTKWMSRRTFYFLGPARKYAANFHKPKFEAKDYIDVPVAPISICWNSLNNPENSGHLLLNLHTPGGVALIITCALRTPVLNITSRMYGAVLE